MHDQHLSIATFEHGQKMQWTLSWPVKATGRPTTGPHHSTSACWMYATSVRWPSDCDWVTDLNWPEKEQEIMWQKIYTHGIRNRYFDYSLYQIPTYNILHIPYTETHNTPTKTENNPCVTTHNIPHTTHKILHTIHKYRLQHTTYPYPNTKYRQVTKAFFVFSLEAPPPFFWLMLC